METTELWVQAFQLRDIREGGGERELFYHVFLSLIRLDTTITDVTLRRLLSLVPVYGCWRDLWVLYRKASESVVTYRLRPLISQLAYDQLLDDERRMAADQDISLLAKWLPRESSNTFQGLAVEFARQWGWPRSSYRRRVAALNRYLATVEIDMCGRTWRNIRPDAVPRKNLRIHTKAFQNETYKVRRRTGARILLDDGELRFPDDPDRGACREHFQAYLGAMASEPLQKHVQPDPCRYDPVRNAFLP